MKRRFPLIAMVTLMAGIAHAQHHGLIRVAGASITATTITVNITDGNSQTLAPSLHTKFSNTDTAITPTDIKLGAQAVIQATKKDDQLTAVQVKVGAGGTSHHGS
jgi:hypothetical protein